jgi:hypothetical protein
MAGLLLGRARQVEADRQRVARAHGELDRIGNVECPRRDLNERLACEGDRPIARRIDRRRTGADRSCDMDCVEAQRAGTERIRKPQPDTRTAGGDADDLPQRRIAQVFGRQSIARLGNLLRRSPGSYPSLGKGGARSDCEQQRRDRCNP